MNILVVCQYYSPEPFRIIDICQELVLRGNTVTVLTGLPNYPEGKVLSDYKFCKKRLEIIEGVKVVRCFEIGRGSGKIRLALNYVSFALSGSIKALYLKENFDVVFVNQLSPVLMALPAIIYKKKNNVKLVLYCLDLWPDSLSVVGIKDGVIYNLFNILSKYIYRSSDTILTSSSQFNDYLSTKFSINSNKIKYLPQYAEDIFTVQKKVKKYNDDSIFNLTFAGNIGEAQSVSIIVEAANLFRNNKKIFFNIYGDGSCYEKCVEQTKKLGLKNIKFYGRLDVSEMPLIYSNADAMLVTLNNDEGIIKTLPGKVQSYMAAAKPIISAASGITLEVIKLSKSGLYCESGDVETLAILIEKMYKEQDKILEYSKNSFQYYNENFSRKKFLTKLIDCLNEKG